ncbi:MAG: Rieske 2Fe-2S domain-containing protein [Bryobacteraceae bacterium]|jgi:nitrite reductase/ring-hydroxylating ferredoxin subunit
MPFVKVARLVDLPPDSVAEVFARDQPYAICNLGGEVRALNGICPHHGGPLGQGQMRDGRVICPFHLWEFDCRTGACDFNPSRGVRTYAVKVEGGDILIQVP